MSRYIFVAIDGDSFLTEHADNYLWGFAGNAPFCSYSCAIKSRNGKGNSPEGDSCLYAGYPIKANTVDVIETKSAGAWGWLHCACCDKLLYKREYPYDGEAEVLQREIIVDGRWWKSQWVTCDDCYNLDDHWKRGKKCRVGGVYKNFRMPDNEYIGCPMFEEGSPNKTFRAVQTRVVSGGLPSLGKRR